MGGGSKTTTQSSSTTSNSPQVTALTNNLASQLQTQLNAGSKVYQNPLYTGLSSTTTGGINALTNAANNPGYSSAINDTIGEFGQIAAGNRMGQNDAQWNTVKGNVANDVNSAFNASGRFAGGANAERLGNGLAAVDLQRIQGNEARQMAAASALPGLFSAGLAPAQAQIAAGSMLDADALAARQADAQLWDANANRGWDDLARASSILSGTAQAAGNTTTQRTTQPGQNPFQTALGGALGLFGLFG